MRTNHRYRIFEAFRLPPDISRWLRAVAQRTGKTKTRLVEEALRSKMALKQP